MTEEALTFEDFFEQTHQQLFGGLCLISGSRHEAEEIMQDAYLKVWERWDRIGVMQEPNGYLYRTAMNAFRSRYRRGVLALRRTTALAPQADDLSSVEDRDQVVRLLRQLPRAERGSIVLTTMFGFTSEEAGRMLGMKPATVRSHASRARADVRAGSEESS